MFTTIVWIAMALLITGIGLVGFSLSILLFLIVDTWKELR